jgi:uncharacterized protein HemX
MKPTVELPFQVQSLIDQMLNKKDNIYVRGNLRSRLDQMRMAVNEAIKKYDNELMLANTEGRKKR